MGEEANRRESCSLIGWEADVKKISVTYAIAPVIFALAAGCSAMSGEKRDSGNASSGSGDEVTVAGCLSSDANGRFALTAMTDATGGAVSRGFDNDIDTKSYVLNGGENLQAHLGKRVEVIGTVVGKTLDMEHKDTKEQQEPAASGGDHNQPTVKTKEEIDMQARQLNVREVRDVTGTCPTQ
jgi:hypothetical protein